MKIFCIGRNYAEHAAELQNEVPDDPVFFLKPDTAVLPKGQDFYLPAFSKDIHYEVELVLRICKEGKHVREEFASKYYDQITVGLDFTARDVQQNQKTRGLPWEPAKAFDHSSPVGDFIPVGDLKNKKDIQFELLKNGELVQSGQSAMMLFSFDQIISHLSKYITLRKGDFVFTGTPKGVGPVAAGDVLEAKLEGRKLLEVRVK